MYQFLINIKVGRDGKKSLKNLTKMETGELKRVTSMRLKVSEIRQNLWRQYRDGGGTCST